MLQSLEEFDVDLHLEPEDLRPPGQGVGILLFDQISAPVLDFVARASSAGKHRVLALALENPVVAKSWQVLDAGAADVISVDQWANSPGTVAQKLERWSEIDKLVASSVVARRLVGETQEWRSLLRQVVEVGRFTQSAVLISGETGTGKELIARAIHDLDQRSGKGRFVILDCTTIIESLSGSEFFGHEKGAFTGALATRDGAFALANGGTLFLDEIGELPLSLQAELLRVIQEGTYKRVGSNTWKKTAFRLICATNRDLEVEKREGRFRLDLFYRIAAWRLRTPCLSERRGDIVPLTRYFLDELAEGEPPEIDPALKDVLTSRDYPGNVRELRHLIARLYARHVGTGQITIGDLPEDERPAAVAVQSVSDVPSIEGAVRDAIERGMTLREIKAAVGEAAVELALHREDGNLHRAAALLGVTDRALQQRRAARRMQETGVGRAIRATPAPPTDR